MVPSYKLQPTNYFLFRFTYFDEAVILGRCVPAYYLRDGIASIPEYIGFWHYVTHDLTSYAYVLMATIFITTGACVLIFLIIIKFPEDAAFHCMLTSFLIIVFSVFYLTYRASRSRSSSTSALLPFWYSDFLTHFFGILCTIFGLNSIIVASYIHRMNFGRTRGFMIRASKCFKRFPKLLSQPVWTLIVCFAIFIYIVLYFFYVVNCQQLEASENNLYAIQSPDRQVLTTAAVFIPTAVVLFWLILVVKIGQKTIVARTVCQWYFAENKSTLYHPITSSVLTTLYYNLGSVASCSFSGWIQYETVIMLTSFYSKSNKISDRIANPPLTSVKSYLSPIAPISLGVYGFIRPTNICGDPYFDYVKFNRLRMTYFEEKRLTREKQKLPASKHNLNKIIQDVHASTKWCIRSCWISFTCLSIPMFLMLEDIKNDRGYIKPIPPILALLLAYFICDIWFSVLMTVFDTLAICLYEDIDRNDGKENLYYGSRGFLYRVTGARVLLVETKAGMRYTEKLRKEREKQKAREEYLKIAEARARNKRRMRMKKVVKYPKKKLKKLADRVRSFNLTQHESGLTEVTSIINQHIQLLRSTEPSVTSVMARENKLFNASVSKKYHSTLTLPNAVSRDSKSIESVGLVNANQGFVKDQEQDKAGACTSQRITRGERKEASDVIQVTKFSNDNFKRKSKHEIETRKITDTVQKAESQPNASKFPNKIKKDQKPKGTNEQKQVIQSNGKNSSFKTKFREQNKTSELNDKIRNEKNSKHQPKSNEKNKRDEIKQSTSKSDSSASSFQTEINEEGEVFEANYEENSLYMETGFLPETLSIDERLARLEDVGRTNAMENKQEASRSSRNLSFDERLAQLEEVDSLNSKKRRGATSRRPRKLSVYERSPRLEEDSDSLNAIESTRTTSRRQWRNGNSFVDKEEFKYEKALWDEATNF